VTQLANTVLLDAFVWAAWSVAVGAAAHRVPTRFFARDTWVTSARAWERDGRVYERVRIRRWKDRVPDAGEFFDRSASKRTIGSRSQDDIERYLVETRRAEYVHDAIVLVTPAFALWNPWPLRMAMAAYAIVANVPCIAIQRYNRARLKRIVARRTAPTPSLR